MYTGDRNTCVLVVSLDVKSFQIKFYLYLISKEAKSHNHVSRLVDLLQDSNCLGEEDGRVRSAVLWDRSTEILSITAKDEHKHNS